MRVGTVVLFKSTSASKFTSTTLNCNPREVTGCDLILVDLTQKTDKMLR